MAYAQSYDASAAGLYGILMEFCGGILWHARCVQKLLDGDNRPQGGFVMEARTATGLSEISATAERERTLLNRIRDLEKQLLRASAIAMVAVIWIVMPIGALAAMYSMSGSLVAPLCLLGAFVVLALVSYTFLSRMLIAAEEPDIERRLAILTAPVKPAMVQRPRQAADELHKTAA